MKFLKTYLQLRLIHSGFVSSKERLICEIFHYKFRKEASGNWFKNTHQVILLGVFLWLILRKIFQHERDKTK